MTYLAPEVRATLAKKAYAIELIMCPKARKRGALASLRAGKHKNEVARHANFERYPRYGFEFLPIVWPGIRDLKLSAHSAGPILQHCLMYIVEY